MAPWLITLSCSLCNYYKLTTVKAKFAVAVANGINGWVGVAISLRAVVQMFAEYVAVSEDFRLLKEENERLADDFRNLAQVWGDDWEAPETLTLTLIM